MTDYYDELLGSIVVCLAGGVLVGLLTPIAFHLGVLFGALAAMAFVYDGLFVHPPLPETDPRRRPADRPAGHDRSIRLPIREAAPDTRPRPRRPTGSR